MARVREMRIFGAYGPKPVWRGRIHQVAFFLSLPAGLWLLAGATTAAARVAVAVYWASMAGLFFTSSSYLASTAGSGVSASSEARVGYSFPHSSENR